MNRILLAVSLAFVLWIAGMALVMRYTDAAPAAVVLWPSKSFLHHLPAQAAIVDVSDIAVTFANRPDLARDLYASGAWIVLPGGVAGGLPLSQRQKDALSRR